MAITSRLIRSTLRITALLVLIGVTMAAPRPQRMTGFSAAAAKKQRAIEEKFKAIPSAAEEERQHRYFTAEPHPAGSERNNELAKYVADQWKQQGLEDVTIHRYDVLNSFPRQVTAEMVAPVYYKASLREDPHDVDPDTKNPRIDGGYLGMSASGEVTAPLVYAHSGNPEDYALLRKHGIGVNGKIVLVRYSNPYSYRGFKALTAQREGAAAMIVYSDPAEDGYKKGTVFPDGPWGPESHIQRGAITYDFMVPGDPLTPGWASVPGAKQIPIEQAISVPKIIALPMSWRDAKHLLEKMDGPLAPPSWQGGLPVKYRLGGNAVKVHVKVDMDTSVKPNYVVEGRIRGAQLPDEWIVFGNHRDAWVFGGVDPSSGTASMMELTRALGELKGQGIRPKRTLVVCSWDGEEVGLTGSTEWGEQFADVLKKKAIAYVNVDSSVSGPNFSLSAVASLAPLLVELSKDFRDPSGKSLYQAWKASESRKLESAGKKGTVPDAKLVDTRIGSGSDHTVFLNHLGMPVISLTFDGPYGVYHSMYDDHYWISHIADPGFKYHTLLSQFWGVLALRLANAEILPFDFEFYARNLRAFVHELARHKGVRSNLKLQPILKRIAEFESAGRQLKLASARTLARGAVDSGLADRVNREIKQVELNWLNPDGIPGRPWFQHVLYAARYTYAHLELPGLTEAVEKGDWKVAAEQAAILEAALDKNVSAVRDATTTLSPQTAANSPAKGEGK